MSPASVREYLRTIRQRYLQASKAVKSQILTEVCAVTGHHRKSAIRALRHLPRPPHRASPRTSPYTERTIQVLKALWEAADYPWSVRLKAMLPLWLPWAKRRLAIPPTIERQLLAISPRTIDRHLRTFKTQFRGRLYGRTKPGTLLKRHIPIKADRWDVTVPGFGEIDLVDHGGPATGGVYVYSLNFTDITTTWVETRAVLGKSQRAVHHGLEEIAAALPFTLQGLDSDNGSEFINDHLVRYCRARGIQFTRIRPYKKDDNAHIEQKNWTHVRKLLGWDRYDSPDACSAINDLYRHEWRLMMNLFQPSVKLVRKIHVGSRLKRVYDHPQTPLDRLLACTPDHPQALALSQLRQHLDPFALAETIQGKLDGIFHLASRRLHPTSRRGPEPFQLRPLPIRPRPRVGTATSSVTPKMAR